MFLCLLHLTRLFNDQLIKVTLIKGIVQPLSCYLQSGTPKMSKHWLQEKQNMTVFMFQIVHSFCLYGNMTLKRNIYISGKGCPIARPFYGYGSKSINIDSIGYTMANISWSSLVSTSLWNISYFRGTSWFRGSFLGTCSFEVTKLFRGNLLFWVTWSFQGIHIFRRTLGCPESTK